MEAEHGAAPLIGLADVSGSPCRSETNPPGGGSDVSERLFLSPSLKVAAQVSGRPARLISKCRRVGRSLAARSGFSPLSLWPKVVEASSHLFFLLCDEKLLYLLFNENEQFE